MSLTLQVSVLAIRFAGSIIFRNYALVFESFHILTDITVTAAVFVGIRIANSRSGMKYSYGLYRIEDLVSLAIALLIVYTALDILVTLPSSRPQSNFQAATVELISLVPLLFSGLVKIRGGKTLRATSLVSDGYHNYSDVYVGMGVTAGLFLSYFTGEIIFYYLAVIIAAGAILYTSFSIGKDSVVGIMDLPKDKNLVPKIREIVTRNKDVWEIKSIKARWAGAVIFVELVVTVNSRLTIEEAHNVANSLEKALLAEIPDLKDVVIHIEPSSSREKVILFPVKGDGTISETFARSTKYKLLKYSGEEMIGSKIIDIPPQEIASEKNALRILEIAKNNEVTDVITFNAGQIVLSVFEVNHIHIWKAKSPSIEENVSLFFMNQLEQLVA
ncbi:MAG: cation diffusion facilitator family transporter [Thermoplasmata archaeon]